MKQIKQEYHATVQEKKTGGYGEKQYHQQYIILPAPLCLQQKIETGQIFKIKTGEEGGLTLSRVKSKPVKAKDTYPEWLHAIKPFLPTQPPGKSPSEIYREAGVILATFPAIWVRRAETDHELGRFYDPVTRRIRWATPVKSPQGSPMQKLKETKLTDLAYEALPLKSAQLKNGLKQAPVARVDGYGTLR